MHKTVTIGAVLLLLGGILPVWSRAETALDTRPLLGGTVRMLVPTAFRPMPEHMLKLKYPMERRPTLVLSNESGSVSLAVNHTQSALRIEQLAEVHQVLERTFRNLHPSASWYRSELITLNGRQFALLELRTPAIDTEVRNLMLATSVEGRLLLISVNLTRELEREWLAVANRMIHSVTLHR